MSQIGRIGGPVLSANLLRDGSDLAFETDLLYLSVADLSNPLKTVGLGINNDSPSQKIQVTGTSHFARSNPLLDDLRVTTQADLASLTFLTYKIQNSTGNIVIRPDQSVDPKIVTNEIRTAKLKLVDSGISTLSADDAIQLTANGAGEVQFYTTSLEISGNLQVTKNLTWDGDTITIGSDDTDKVTFNADIKSSILPDTTSLYNLGSPTKKWNTLYSQNIDTQTLEADTLVVNGIDMLLTQGKTIYVSVNGNDSNIGVHLHNTYRTIKYALQHAVSGDNIVIFPGIYVEDFPLTVPQGVSVTGSGIRSVTVSPTVGTNNKDAFLLNGESTVCHLTVKGVYYDSINNTGYGFRFAPNFKVTTRSPYIQNVSVLNSLPNAGPGALADGSVADPTSVQASMLFHAVTFIVPNADGITATNGARVEWLNSFTYFANRGIYLTEGTLGFASLGVKFGAEMRSIGSANVYGNYGAVADGASTLGYLVGHNFGYIGTGLDSQNDYGLVIQANEVVAINGGQLYYDSMDHKGDYRIGDIFYVNQETGAVAFNAQALNFSSNGSIVLEGISGRTVIEATGVSTGNIRIHDNNIDSVFGPVNFSAQSGTTTLNTHVTVTGALTVSGDVLVKGNVFLGNDPLDTVSVIPKLTQTIKPDLNSTFTLGTDGVTPKVWRDLYVTSVDVDGITQLTNNTITTLTTDTNLRLVAAGTGIVSVPLKSVDITNNLQVTGTTTINGSSSLQNVEIVGVVNLTGNIDQTGDTGVTGDIISINNIIGHDYLQSSRVQISGNYISAIDLDADINFTANGTGGVVLDSKLRITDNTITNVWSGASTNTQQSILFTPNGTGSVVINSTKAIKVPTGNDTNRVLSTLGEVRLNSSTLVFEGKIAGGIIPLKGIYDSDRNTYITPELTVGANDNILRFFNNNVLTTTIDTSRLLTSTYFIDNIKLNSNTINNRISGDDLIFAPNGTGAVNLNDVSFPENTIRNNTNGALTINSTGIGYVKFNGTYGIVVPTGTGNPAFPPGTPQNQRPVVAEVGEIRHNTTLNYMEVYNGTAWIPAVGTLGAAPLGEVLDIMDFWGLILG